MFWRQYCSPRQLLRASELPFRGFSLSMDLQPELPLPPRRRGRTSPTCLHAWSPSSSICSRLAYLEWVQGEWAESADTIEGRGVHRRVDGPSGDLPEAEAIGDDERIHVRSVTLSSDRLGLIAKLDLVEVEDGVGCAGRL
jgi:CRISPR-associated protein Cas1